MIWTSSELVFIGSKKKCDFVRSAVDALNGIKFEILIWDKKADIEPLLEKIRAFIPEKNESIGVLQKEYEKHSSKLVSAVHGITKEKKIVDITGGVSLCLSVKDGDEMGTLQKSAVLTNKVLKRFFVSFI